MKIYAIPFVMCLLSNWAICFALLVKGVPWYIVVIFSILYWRWFPIQMSEVIMPEEKKEDKDEDIQ